MIVSFNRHTGEITELGDSIDNYNRKTVNIKNVNITKYEAVINPDEFIPKTDIYGIPVYVDNNNRESSIIRKKITMLEKGDVIENEFGIELYQAKSALVEPLAGCVEVVKDSLYYFFPENYKKFSINEVMEEHYRLLLDLSDCEYILADNFGDLTNILITSSTFRSLNKWEIQLAPGQEIKLKSIDLLAPVNQFKTLEINTGIDIKINDMPLDALLTFKSPISKINISFKNTSNSVAILDSYAIGYSFSEEVSK